MSDDERQALLSNLAELEFVPHKGSVVRADKKVIMSYQCTAKERYQWSLLAARRGQTISDIIREHLNGLLEEEHDDL
jgi:hypothetical protein